MTRRARHRKLRRERGMCREDGCDKYTGDAMRCPGHEAEHLKHAAKWQRDHRRRLKEALAAAPGA